MSLTLKILVFLVVSIALAWLTRSSLRSFRSHGFYRLFAWVAIVALVLLNLDSWFFRPFSIHQVISRLLLLTSLFLVFHGIWYLRMTGKPDSKRSDPSLISIEKTTELVTVGDYRTIRHPLYSLLLFLAWGAFFKLPSPAGGGLAILATVFLTATAKVEEVENTRYFGAGYSEYMKHTKMFIPFLY